MAVQLAFNHGTIVSFVYPLGALLLAAFGALAVHYVTTAFERERVRDMFSRFVPEDVVDEVLARTDGGRCGSAGSSATATVMFSDLRGFTSFAETLPPDQVIEVLNQYLRRDERRDPRPRRDAGRVHGRRDHGRVRRADRAGRPCRPRARRRARDAHERLPRFNEWLRGEGLGEGFRMGIGLNSGR